VHAMAQARLAPIGLDLHDPALVDAEEFEQLAQALVDALRDEFAMRRCEPRGQRRDQRQKGAEVPTGRDGCAQVADRLRIRQRGLRSRLNEGANATRRRACREAPDRASPPNGCFRLRGVAPRVAERRS